ncbi:MAG: AbgT family transporter [Phycisphaeraceae bacterium]|nr:AbgT family transporter [Phycisphaeraceae bacterium]
MSQSASAPRGVMQRFLDVVERVGNKVPHPVLLFVGLTVAVVVVSALLTLFGVSVTQEFIDKETNEIRTTTVTAQSLLSSDGIRFMYAAMIPNFMGFTAVGLIIVAMIGVGVAEESGLIRALIRKLVAVSPASALAYILVFVGILSSIAADAGYLVLVPLAGTAFLSVGRHPIAGLAAGFAAVAGAFTVNMLIKPLDAILTEFTNDAIRVVDPSKEIGLAATLWFSIASVIVLTLLITFITQRVIEPRLGKYKPEDADPEVPGGAETGKPGDAGNEPRGLRFAFVGLLASIAFFVALSAWPGAPLRDPETGSLIGNSPFMNGLIAFIMVVFLVVGACYGVGAGTMKSATEVIKAMEKAVGALGSLLLLLFVLSQFIAYFNYSNMASLLAVGLSNLLKDAGLPPLVLLLGFIVVVALLDLLITGAIAKWALFAPIFVPLLMKLDVDPAAVLSAYRLADSPVNVITPLNAYFALIVTFAQKYDRKAGVGTVVALMLPFVAWMFIVWTALFVLWHLLGLPWGIS